MARACTLHQQFIDGTHPLLCPLLLLSRQTPKQTPPRRKVVHCRKALSVGAGTAKWGIEDGRLVIGAGMEQEEMGGYLSPSPRAVVGREEAVL